MDRSKGAMVALSLGLLAAAGGAPAAEAVACGETGIRVAAAAAADVRHACRAARAAESFASRHGLQWPRGLLLEIGGAAGEGALAEETVGQYEPADRRLRVRAFAALAGRMASRALWRSYVVHELTHAAVHRTCDKTCPRRAIHEYVAAVAQLSSLPEPERRRWLDQYRQLTGFAQDEQITEIYYDIEPRQFAAQAYRHYRRAGNPAALIRRLVSLP